MDYRSDAIGYVVCRKTNPLNGSMLDSLNTGPVLVVDDDRTIRHVLRESLAADGHEVITASDVSDCIAKIGQLSPKLVLLDLNLPDGNGIDVLQHVRSTNSTLPVVLITAEGDSESAIRAARYGARDYLTKPLDLRQLRHVVRRLTQADDSSQDNEAPILPQPANDDFIGRSAAMQPVFKSIGRVAKQPVSVLIRGESGVGKELAARATWRHSDRANEVFLAVNCAALSGDLLESELFGHEKGAFTGAVQRHIGKFEVCQHGTLFLDEVGDMQPAMQAKLLRVLQERCFTRVGGSAEIPTDARIISATNRDLEAMSKTGDFREDLFHRLNGFSIQIPPLRQRGEDIPLLLGHLLHRYNQKLNTQVSQISASAAAHLTQYSWPGNVRELESLLGQVMLNSHDSAINSSDLPGYIVSRRSARSFADPPQDLAPDNSASSDIGAFEAFVNSQLAHESESVYESTLEFVERYLLGRVLEQTNGNQSAASRKLGITRGSLRFKLKSLGMTIDSEVKVPR